MTWEPTPDAAGRLFDHYVVVMRRNSDGKVIKIAEKLPWHGSSWFWWFEGNMACDCNRHQSFERASGRDDSDELYDEATCSDGKYSVLEFQFPDGTTLLGETGVEGLTP